MYKRQLYDYQKNAFQVSNWSGTSTRWYTPMKSEYKELIPKLIDIVQNGIFLGMDKELLKESWFVRTFLCDSLCDASSYNKRRLVEDYFCLLYTSRLRLNLKKREMLQHFPFEVIYSGIVDTPEMC